MAMQFPPRRILAAMDFSPAARCALRAAADLGALFRARLELVCVQEPETLPVDAELMSMGLDVQIQMDRQKRLLAALRKRLRQAAAAADSGRAVAHALTGPPAAILSRLAAPPHADLVVMGIHDSPGAGPSIFGSVAETVVRRARVPVLTVHRRRGPLDLRRILCPVDLTPNSGRVLAYAAQMASALGATLCALHVVAPEDDDPWPSSLQSFLRLTLGEAAGKVETLTTRGDVRGEIVRQAERGGFDLLVLCEHLRPWSADRLLGTTAERALRRASIPVLAVPYEASREHPHWLARDARRGARRPLLV